MPVGLAEKSRPERTGLRRWLHGLRFTPLHPQFFAYRYERLRYEIAGASCRGRVLDIGCGKQPLRRHLKDGCEYVSVDHPQTGLEYGAQPAVFADAASLPFADATFDTIVCLEVLEHLLSPSTAMREACRVLRPQGQLIISTPFLYPIHDAPADYRRWTRHGLETLASSSNLRVESLRGLGTPLECGVLALNLGISWHVLNAAMPLRLPLLALGMMCATVLNLFAWAHSGLSQHKGHNPFAIGYFAVLAIDEQPHLVPGREQESSPFVSGASAHTP